MSDELTGEELAAAVAERVMGWRRAGHGVWRVNPGEVYKADEYRHDFRPDLNIAQAWEVVEHLQKRNGWILTVHQVSHGWWRAEFTTSGEEDGPFILSDVRGCETAPIAICLAALAAVEAGDG